MDEFGDHDDMVRTEALRKLVILSQHLREENGAVLCQVAVIEDEWNSWACVFDAGLFLAQALEK